MASVAMAVSLIVTAACMSPAAHAGQSCEEKPLTLGALTRALDTAKKLQERLSATQSEVAIIGRQGQDLSKYRLKYSHVGFAIKNQAGQWQVTELLNQCGSTDSKLWVDGLATFFLDDPFTYDAIIMTPPKAQQEIFKGLVAQNQVLHSLHHDRYNMVAYPFSVRYQNSNQWVLEVTAKGLAMSGGKTERRSGGGEAAALDLRTELTTREDIQKWLLTQNYKPTELQIGAFTRLGGRMTKANIAFDDHPSSLRFSDRINTVTVESMAAFLKQYDWSVQEVSSGP